MPSLSLRTTDLPVRPLLPKEAGNSDPFVKRLQNHVSLTPSDFDALRAVIESEQPVKKRRDLVLDGYEFCKLCFVKDGYAARYKLLRNGKRQIVSFVLPGDVVGLPGSFLDRAAQSVIAVSDMNLRVCSLEAFVALCYARPQFALALTWLAVQEATIYAEHVIDIGRRSPTERLAHLLLEIHWRLTVIGIASESAFDLPFTQEMLSDALGLSVPHVNRTLSRLKAEGMICVDERHITFPDLRAIRLFAQFQPANPGRVPAPVPIRRQQMA